MRAGCLGIILVLAAAAGGQPPKQQPPLPPLPPGVKAIRDLEYVPGGHERQKLDLFFPEQADRPLPLIVWIHGGGWRGGSKERGPFLQFIGKGYVVASINYRLSQHAVFPAQIEDCKAAIRWLRANAPRYHIDPKRIGVWGGSAGGHLVALLGTSGDVKELEGSLGNLDQSSRVQAVVDWYGPADFPNWTEIVNDPKRAESQLLGGTIADKKALAALASPVTFASKDDPPFLIMHGDQDPVVALRQSELLHAALKKAGVDVVFKVWPGAKHGGPEFLSPESRKMIEDFFRRTLQPDADR